MEAFDHGNFMPEVSKTLKKILKFSSIEKKELDEYTGVESLYT